LPFDLRKFGDYELQYHGLTFCDALRDARNAAD
jgi:hypothetical protein